MSQFDFLSTQFENKKNDYTTYLCPYCKQENNMNTIECNFCGSQLSDYESIVFCKYNYYNHALELCKEKKYVSALEKIIVFLEHYSMDVDAQRLYLYILFCLKDSDFESKAEFYIKNNNDRWIGSFVDNPKDTTINQFPYKQLFEGNSNQTNVNNEILIKQNYKNKMVNDLLDTINKMYSIYTRYYHNRKFLKDRNANEFIIFYEKTLTLFLKKYDIEVENILYQNINDFNEEKLKSFGNVDEIYNHKKENGFIIEVFCPEIKLRNIIIQKAKITVVSNKKNKSQEKK